MFQKFFRHSVYIYIGSSSPHVQFIIRLLIKVSLELNILLRVDLTSSPPNEFRFNLVKPRKEHTRSIFLIPNFPRISCPNSCLTFTLVYGEKLRHKPTTPVYQATHVCPLEHLKPHKHLISENLHNFYASHISVTHMSRVYNMHI